MSSSNNSIQSFLPYTHRYVVESNPRRFHIWSRTEQEPAIGVVEKLEREPTVDKLEELLKKHPNFSLHSGGHNGMTVLAVAMAQGKFPLFRAILQRDRSLANGMFHVSKVPYIIYSVNTLGLRAAKALVAAGADVDLQSVAKKPTALQWVAEREDIPMTKFFLQCGGTICRKAMGQDQTKLVTTLNRAITELHEEHFGKMFFVRRLLHSARSHYPIDVLPEDIRIKIWDYVEEREDESASSPEVDLKH